MSDGILRPINYPYGLLPKEPMRDKSISIQAKGLYAYLIAYAGSKNIAFPSISLITHELGISKSSFNKYIKELREVGYVIVTQERSDTGTFDHNVYELSPCSKLPCTVKPSTMICTTKNNSIKNNNIKSNTMAEVQDNINFIKVIEFYKDKPLPKYTKITPKRKNMVNARIKEYSVDTVLNGLDMASKSEFLNKTENKSWYNFDWIFNPNNFVKILEGKYNKAEPKAKTETQEFLERLKKKGGNK